MKADTSAPCSCCGELMAVARIAIVSDQGELVDYADLCRACIREAADQVGLALGALLDRTKDTPTLGV
jgi:hypothetical protein